MNYRLLVLLLALTGCAGEHVKNLGAGMHSVSACSDDRITNSQVVATRAANRYCEKSGQEAVVTNFDNETCPESEASTTRVVFACR